MECKLKVLDLFSGIGGFSLGLERAGMETIAFCEIDIECQKILQKHWPQTLIFSDVSTLSYPQGYVDIICGGFPCQDISVAGNQKGLEGERSGLWFEYKRIIKETKPRYVIIENVANLRSKGLVTVLQDLWQIGYDSEWHIISACGVGALHRRERVWIIAYPYSEKLRKQSRGIVGESGEGETLSRITSEERNVTDTYNLRFRRTVASPKEKQKWRAETASRFRYLREQVLETQPSVRRGDDGLSRKLDKKRRARIKQLGNAVLPQIPQLIGEAIIEYERDNG